MATLDDYVYVCSLHPSLYHQLKPRGFDERTHGRQNERSAPVSFHLLEETLQLVQGNPLGLAKGKQTEQVLPHSRTL